MSRAHHHNTMMPRQFHLETRATAAAAAAAAAAATAAAKTVEGTGATTVVQGTGTKLIWKVMVDTGAVLCIEARLQASGLLATASLLVLAAGIQAGLVPHLVHLAMKQLPDQKGSGLLDQAQPSTTNST